MCDNEPYDSYVAECLRQIIRARDMEIAGLKEEIAANARTLAALLAEKGTAQNKNDGQ